MRTTLITRLALLGSVLGALAPPAAARVYPGLLGQEVLSSVDLVASQEVLSRFKRQSTGPDDRPSCPGGTNNAINTTDRLEELRRLMADTSVTEATKPISAFFLPMDDSHQSEYVAEADQRIKFISGFTGSSGQVVVTTSQAALWTDGRYFLQGEDQLDCSWTFMKHGQPDVPGATDWITQQLNTGDLVGVDARQVYQDYWVNMKITLASYGIDLVEVPNLVDLAWGSDRPAEPAGPLHVWPTEYAGLSWSAKVDAVREEMSGKAEIAIYTALDDNAWLFNLRGNDIPYNPVFFSYSIVERSKVTLFIRNHTDLLTQEIKSHLNHPNTGECNGNGCVIVKDYDTFFEELGQLSSEITGKVWLSPMSSYKAFSSVSLTSDDQIYSQASLVLHMKGQKNPTEISGLRKCHIRDSAALIEFIAMLEEEVKAGKPWDEISAATELKNIRESKELNRGLSFPSISGSGPNGAIIHYKATEETKRAITTSDMYLLDSGGQYLDGTTDVTRTFHFGTPTDFQKEAYTRVLMASINLATAVWPQGLYGHQIDVYARRPLWAIGLDYRHGTGHGIGAYLSVHEGPGRINIGYRPQAYESILYPSMFFSDEPGYYQDNEFGIRLETIVMVTQINTDHRFNDVDYLGFEYFTLVPFEPNLIDYDLLTPEMRVWLNGYNAKIRAEVAEKVLKPANDMRAYNWVMARTEPIPTVPVYENGASGVGPSILTALLALMAYTGLCGM